MPNWTSTLVTMKGIGKMTELYSESNGRLHFDFNKIVPEPKTPEECVEKYGSRYLDSVDENGKSTRALMHSDGDDWFNWYDWHCDFWGTKWNACETHIIDDDHVRFDTAWADPVPIFEALSSKHPDLELTTESVHEDCVVSGARYAYGACVENNYLDYSPFTDDGDFDQAAEEAALEKVRQFNSQCDKNEPGLT